MNNPSILSVIGDYVHLRRMGREHKGLCPFHAEKTPSFAVNEDKNVFYCFGCGFGGDVFTFIQQIKGVDFKTAARHLGMETYRPHPEDLRRKDEAKTIVQWAYGTSIRLRNILLEIGNQIHTCKLARKEPYADREFIVWHEAALMRQWAILCDLDDDLNNPKTAIELWAQREDIEHLVEMIA
jgi:hypothetical protein